VAQPPPLPLLNFYFDWLLLSSHPQFLISYLDRPEYFQYSVDASIDEDLKLMYDGFSLDWKLVFISEAVTSTADCQKQNSAE